MLHISNDDRYSHTCFISVRRQSSSNLSLSIHASYICYFSGILVMFSYVLFFSETTDQIQTSDELQKVTKRMSLCPCCLCSGSHSLLCSSLHLLLSDCTTLPTQFPTHTAKKYALPISMLQFMVKRNNSHMRLNRRIHIANAQRTCLLSLLKTEQQN